MTEGMDVYSLMQTGTPFHSYIKTILGKIYLNIWDSFNNKPVGIILTGNPGANPEGCIVDTWNEKEDLFFKRSNKRHFETGFLISYTRPQTIVEKSPNEFTDEELINLLNSRFMTLQHAVNKMTSVAPVFRITELARKLEKSEKIIKFLEGKQSELQLKEYAVEEV